MDKKSHIWKPITDLPEDMRPLIDAQLEALVAAWLDHAKELQEKESYNEFLIRLRRQWAIETGVLERLYTLSDGVTKTLIEQGLDAAYLSHEDTPPPQVLAMICDQQAVVEGLYQFVSGDRPMGTSYVKELHRALTEHQVSYEAVDTLGQYVQRVLPRGEWKKLPNNVEGPGDYVFEFCPPEHVEAEMESLLRMHSKHEESGVPPYIEAAWLHHRFTLIHPFTDGNGRVARCLATLVFLKPHWFPLVVTRQDRNAYIDALREADGGDLKPLVDLFGRLQSKAAREAFSLSEEAHYEALAVKNVLKAVKAKFEQIRSDQETLKKQASVIADALQDLTQKKLEGIALEISAAISPQGPGYRASVKAARRGEEQARYNHYQIGECAKRLGYFANFTVHEAWVNLIIDTASRAELLFSFHGMGKGSTGVLACSGMFYTRQLTDTGDSVIGDIHALSNEPYTFTYTQDPTDVERGFRRWLNDRIVLGLDHWRKAVGA